VRAVRYEVRGRCAISSIALQQVRGSTAMSGLHIRETRAFVLVKQEGLKWFCSVTDETPNVHRGFVASAAPACSGTPGQRTNIAVAAGS